MKKQYLERGERLKQAKLEAESEVTAYRKQMERTFQMNGNTDVRGHRNQERKKKGNYTNYCVFIIVII